MSACSLLIICYYHSWQTYVFQGIGCGYEALALLNPLKGALPMFEACSLLWFRRGAAHSLPTFLVTQSICLDKVLEYIFRETPASFFFLKNNSTHCLQNCYKKKTRCPPKTSFHIFIQACSQGGQGRVVSKGIPS